MSEPLYKLGGLRFWSEKEILFREMATTHITATVSKTLRDINNAWYIERVESPILTPSDFVSKEYSDNDVFSTNHSANGQPLALRAETTMGSYQYAQHSRKKLPLCIWQAGKSFRRELNDGASASKLRFLEFWQLEFQCIYSSTTKADYRGEMIKAIRKDVEMFMGKESRVVPSDRLPSYSESTLDIELNTTKGWKEIASCSIRNDYTNAIVTEISIGLDRIVSLAQNCLTTRQTCDSI